MCVWYVLHTFRRVIGKENFPIRLLENFLPIPIISDTISYTILMKLTVIQHVILSARSPPMPVKFAKFYLGLKKKYVCLLQPYLLYFFLPTLMFFLPILKPASDKVQKNPCLPLQCDVFTKRMCFRHGTLQITCPGHYLALYMAYQTCSAWFCVKRKKKKKRYPTYLPYFFWGRCSKQTIFF